MSVITCRHDRTLTDGCTECLADTDWHLEEPTVPSREYLFGHVSEETALHCPDYPYSWTLRCEIRYWLETHPKHGDRMVSQTRNPKTGLWNKPKKSTYAPVGVLYYDEEHHVQWDAISLYPTAERLAAFQTATDGHLNGYQAQQLAAIAALHRVMAAREARRLAAESEQ